MAEWRVMSSNSYFVGEDMTNPPLTGLEGRAISNRGGGGEFPQRILVWRLRNLPILGFSWDLGR